MSARRIAPADEARAAELLATGLMGFLDRDPGPDGQAWREALAELHDELADGEVRTARSLGQRPPRRLHRQDPVATVSVRRTGGVDARESSGGYQRASR